MDNPRLMVLAAHTDDAQYGAGATIVRYAKNGSEVMIVNMTDSETGGAPSREIRRQRMLEAGAEAAETLGAKCHFMHYGGDTLDNCLIKQLQVARVIREFRPDIIITHWLKDMHHDHVSTALLTHYGVDFAIKENPKEGIWNLDWHENAVVLKQELEELKKFPPLPTPRIYAMEEYTTLQTLDFPAAAYLSFTAEEFESKIESLMIFNRIAFNDTGKEEDEVFKIVRTPEGRIVDAQDGLVGPAIHLGRIRGYIVGSYYAEAFAESRFLGFLGGIKAKDSL